MLRWSPPRTNVWRLGGDCGINGGWSNHAERTVNRSQQLEQMSPRELHRELLPSAHSWAPRKTGRRLRTPHVSGWPSRSNIWPTHRKGKVHERRRIETTDRDDGRADCGHQDTHSESGEAGN